MSLRYDKLADVPAHLLKPRGSLPTPAAPTWACPVPAEKPKRAKYRNKPVTINGIRFASKLEGRCYEWLLLRHKAGDLHWFARQVNFDLPGGVKYRADFVVVAKDGVSVIDAKGVLTADCRNKLKQMKAVHGIDVVLWTGRP